MRYGASYYPAHRDEREWAGDLDLMAATGFNALRVGDFAWKRMEPREGEYRLDWLDRFIELATRRGIDLLLAPPLRCPPAWLMQQDPTLQIVNESGVRLEFGSRYTCCINHPRLREKGLALAEQLARRYAGCRGVIGWHLDNEYGDEPDCHCDRCRALWQQWLQRRHESIEQLNQRWGTVFWGLEFDDFGQIPTPRLTKTYHHPALLLNWRRFRSDCTVELVGLHAQSIRRHSTAPITTNLQNLWNPRTDYSDLSRQLDHLGLNYYPPWGQPWHGNSMGMALLRGCRPGQGFDIHELRNGPHAVPGRPDNTPQPGEIERLVLYCIGHGAEAIYFFQWSAVPFGPEQTHGTLVGYDGQPKAAWHSCASVGAKLKRLAPRLRGTRVVSQIAVIHDFPTRWAMQGGEEWVGPAELPLEHARRLYRLTRELGHCCDVIPADADLTRYKLVIVPMLSCVDDAVCRRLAHFVEQGGTLLWHPLSGWKDADARIYPTRLHPHLRELFGVDVREYATIGPQESCGFRWRQQRYAAQWFADLPQPRGAQPLGEFDGVWFAGVPALLERSHGRGRAIYLATFADDSFYRDLLPHLCDSLHLKPILHLPRGPQIELLERRGEDGRRLIFIINGTPHPQRLPLTHPLYDLWADEALSTELTLGPWQVRICQYPTTPLYG